MLKIVGCLTNFYKGEFAQKPFAQDRELVNDKLCLISVLALKYNYITIV
jgi:hypothetical protein